MHLFLEGVTLGIVPVFFVGPVLFTLLQASLSSGFRGGAMVALGITASDIVAIALCSIGVVGIFEQPRGQLLLHLLGGIIMAAFGLSALLRARSPEPATAVTTAGTPLRLFASGFLVNFVNPFVLAFWIGAIGAFSTRHAIDFGTITPFFSGTVTVILLTDLAKAWGAHRLKGYLERGAAALAQRVIGVGLLGFGLYLLWLAVSSQ